MTQPEKPYSWFGERYKARTHDWDFNYVESIGNLL
jgi:hypothetical protein